MRETETGPERHCAIASLTKRESVAFAQGRLRPPSTGCGCQLTSPSSATKRKLEIWRMTTYRLRSYKLPVNKHRKLGTAQVRRARSWLGTNLLTRLQNEKAPLPRPGMVAIEAAPRDTGDELLELPESFVATSLSLSITSARQNAKPQDAPRAGSLRRLLTPPCKSHSVSQQRRQMQ